MIRYDRVAGSFGAYDGVTELEDGLNVVYAANEAGKSTLSELIFTLLYGINTSDREKKGYIPPKIKYAPWSGKPMQGSLVLTKDGRQMEIRRTTIRNAPMQSFLAAYTDSGYAVEGMDGDNCGELITGAGREVFVRSALCKGDALAVGDSGELERRIQSISSSGDEETSAARALKTLTAWKNERYANRANGTIPRLTSLISHTESELERARGINSEINRCRREETALLERADRLKDTLRKAELYSKKADLARIGELDELLEAARAELSDCEFPQVGRDELERAAAAVRAEDAVTPPSSEPVPAPLAGLSAEDAVKKAKEDADKFKKLSKKLPALLLAAVGLLLGGSLALINIIAGAVAGVGLALVGYAAAVVVNGRSGKKAELLAHGYGRSDAEGILNAGLSAAEGIRAAESYRVELAKAQSEVSRQLSELGLPPTARASDLIRVASALSRREQLLREIDSLERERSELVPEEGIESLEAAAKELEADTSAAEIPLARVQSELSQTEARLAELRTELALLSGRLSTARDISELSASLRDHTAAKERAEGELEAIAKAYAIIEKAGEELSRRLTPGLSARAGEILSVLTGGKHASLTVRRGFETEVSQDKTGVDPLYLSRGGLDQTYLALRIALSEIAFPDDLPPLILDDVFASFDDERTERGMKLLAELARDRQVILLTCRSRESEAAVRLGGKAVRLSGK